MRVADFAQELGIEICYKFDSKMLVPTERIRAFCKQNKCGDYGNNYMCPPNVGTLEEIGIKLRGFNNGLLLRYSKSLDVKGDKEGVRQTKVDFHNKILQMEEFLGKEGTGRIWGMIGGSCGLCDICGVRVGEPCPYPDKARTSPEAIGIDVEWLLDRFGLDGGFYKDRVTWTGCILF